MRDKTLLVLGASSDMGQYLIKKTYKNYKTIIVHYNSNNSFVDDLKKECDAQIVEYQADFSDSKSTENFVNKLSEGGYSIDHVVHFPATVANPSKFHKNDWKDYENAINVSLRSVVMVLQSVIKGMLKKKEGKIILMLTSYVNNIPPKYQSTYVTIKHALLGLVKALAVEYADKNIQINGVSPEMVETNFLSNLPDFVIEKNATQQPLGRNLKVDDVIPTIEFLLSSGSDYITGQNISITGGK